MLLQVASISETGIEAKLGPPLQEQQLRRGRKWQRDAEDKTRRGELIDGDQENGAIFHCSLNPPRTRTMAGPTGVNVILSIHVGLGLQWVCIPVSLWWECGVWITPAKADDGAEQAEDGLCGDVSRLVG